jgi:hypothetical protein
VQGSSVYLYVMAGGKPLGIIQKNVEVQEATVQIL